MVKDFVPQPPEPRRSNAWRIVLVLVCIGVILLFSTSLLSAERTKAAFCAVLHWLSPDATQEHLDKINFVLRKLAHLTEYGCLAALTAWTTLVVLPLAARRWWFLIALVTVAAVASLDEFHQSFVPGRTGAVTDVLIDIIGGLIALSLIAIWRAIRRRLGRGPLMPLGLNQKNCGKPQ